MIDLDLLYFEWLLTRLDHRGVREGVSYLASLFHRHIFKRRVGNDLERAADGANLRKVFLTDFEEVDVDPRLTNDFMMHESTWLEVLIAMSERLDYLYDGGVEERFIEMVQNLGLAYIAESDHERSGEEEVRDQRDVDAAASDVDYNRFARNGSGGLFPLRGHNHPDQREVEIWDQQAAYFRERLEGVLWTSTS